MYKSFLCAIVLFAAACVATEKVDMRTRYNPGTDSFLEGTVTKVDGNGHIAVRGKDNPYARSYFAYMSEYYDTHEPQRDLVRRNLNEKYGDALNYTWTDDGLTDYIFVTPYPKDFFVFDEPHYGAPLDTWTFPESAPAYSFDDLKIGDRVLLPYNPEKIEVYSIFRINPVRQEPLVENAPRRVVRVGPFGVEYSTGPVTPNIDPWTGMHYMNMPSNLTNNTLPPNDYNPPFNNR